MIYYNNIKADSDRVFVIGFWPYPETSHLNEGSLGYHFKALAITYGVNVQVVYHPEEVENLPDLPIVALEESHADTIDLQDFIHPPNVIYIAGNSQYNNPSDFFKASHRVSIRAPVSGQPLYGDQALAIVLNDRTYLT